MVATISIIVILTGTITITGVNSINNTKKIAFANELVQIQSDVDIYRYKNEDTNPVTGNTYEASSIPNNTSTLYEIDIQKLDIQKLNNGTKKDNDQRDVYVISETGEVFYLKGKKIGANTYYNLNEELKKYISYNSIEEQNNATSIYSLNDNITLEINETKWTNKNVNVKASVPENISNVKVEHIVNTSAVEILGSKQYVINNIDTNSRIRVSYTKSGEAKVADYDISNIDKISPIISSVSYFAEDINGKQTSYASIKSEDNLSGIKIIKYEKGDLKTEKTDEEIYAYFKANGKTISSQNTIMGGDSRYYTIYAEDNSGNYSSLVIELNTISKENADEGKGNIVEGVLIPKNFYYIGGTKNTGLVISDVKDDDLQNSKKGNQYVWIPVTSEADFARKEWNKGITVSSCSEPYSSGYADESAEYDRMKASVIKNKGFFIARYEASMENSVAVSKSGRYPWNNITWNNTTEMNANRVAGTASYEGKHVAEKLGYLGVSSNLVYGVQWDSILKFINTSGINIMNSSSYGNCNGATFNYKDINGNIKTKESGSAVLIPTGSSERNMVQNIYDIAGNVWEWTMEAYSTNSRVVRGGNYVSYGDEYSVAYRQNNVPNMKDTVYGFRVALYIEEETSDPIVDTFVDGVPIPKDFYYMGGTKDTGLVISDRIDDDINNSKGGNQYVWIPMETEADFAKREWYKDTSALAQYCVEPFSGGYATEATEHNLLKVSVLKNKGFYMARYEASNENGIAVSKAMKIPWGNITFNTTDERSAGLVEGSIGYEAIHAGEKLGYTSVQTYLPTGILWDNAVRFVESAGVNAVNSSTYGNYYDVTFTYKDISGETKTKANNSYALTPTGSNERNKTQNIYDMAGNMSERTMEASTLNATRLERGGYCVSSLSTGDNSIAFRKFVVQTYKYAYSGFRTILYIK